MNKLSEIKTTKKGNYGEEHLSEFEFPRHWTKEDYLDFVRQWKETYRVHSRYAHLCKRDRKTVHNVITPEEVAEMTALAASPYHTAARDFVRSATNYHHVFSNKQVARWLLAVRKASKVWAGQRRAEALQRRAA